MSFKNIINDIGNKIKKLSPISISRYEEFKIPKICKPEQVNKDGYRYTAESYHKALKDEYIKELLKTDSFAISCYSQKEYDTMIADKFFSMVVVRYYIDITKIIGYIVDIADDYITIKVNTKHSKYKYIKEKIKENKASAYMVYIGERFKDDKTIYDVKKIVRFDLIIDE